MVDVSVVNQSIRHYVGQVTGLDTDTHIIKANQDVPNPDGLYASVLISPIDKDGHDSIVYSDDVGLDLIEKRSGTRSFMASISFYGENAVNNAFAIEGSPYESANLDFLRAKGIGFKDVSSVRDLSEVERGRYEERGQIDFFFYVIDENENTVLSIQSQKIEGAVDDYDIDIEVTQ